MHVHGQLNPRVITVPAIEMFRKGEPRREAIEARDISLFIAS